MVGQLGSVRAVPGVYHLYLDKQVRDVAAYRRSLCQQVGSGYLTWRDKRDSHGDHYQPGPYYRVMAQDRPPAGTGRPVTRPLPPTPPATTPVVVRGTTSTTRSVQPSNPPHATVYQPWVKLLAQAETRYKTEITAALNDLDRSTAEAGRLLDQAATMAAEASSHLEQAAWSAWAKYMGMADDTRNSVLDRARTAYDQVITHARNQYDNALSDAERTYRAIAQDATRAQADVKAIAS